MKHVRCVLVLISAVLLFGCDPSPTKIKNTPSSAFFSVPASMTGVDSARSVASDAMVSGSVNSYFEMVRTQVSFGGDVANSIKALLTNIEAVSIGGIPLLDYESNIDNTNTTTQERNRWTVITVGSSWRLEQWKSSTKSLELDFTKINNVYSGTVVVSGQSITARDTNADTVYPEWIKVTFNSNFDNLGTAKLEISLTSFRIIPDIKPSMQSAIITLQKDSAGVVTLGSIVKVPNSRHFIWNGYLDAVSGSETLNTGVTSENRYYAAAGKGSGDVDLNSKATIHIGMPKSVDTATVFSAYGLGSVIAQLMADRINNNYDFDAASEVVPGTGAEYITALNNVLTTDLATGNPAINTVDAVKLALETVATSYPSDGLLWLVGLMNVQNPVFFESSSYVGYGTNTIYPNLGTAAAAELLPAQSTLDTLTISFTHAD